MATASRVKSPMVMQKAEKFTFFAYAISRSIVIYPATKDASMARATDVRGISAREWE